MLYWGINRFSLLKNKTTIENIGTFARIIKEQNEYFNQWFW